MNEYRMPDYFFKVLTPEEEVQFRAWARANYKVGDPIKPVWHPVVRAECERMNMELEGM